MINRAKAAHNFIEIRKNIVRIVGRKNRERKETKIENRKGRQRREGKKRRDNGRDK